MSIKTTRVLSFLVVVLLLSLHKWTYAVYPVVLQLFFELVHRYSKVPEDELKKLFALCMVCVLFGLERLRSIYFSESIEFAINVFEHAYFAFVFCAIFGVIVPKNQLGDNRWKVFLLFNGIGVLNEVYQYAVGKDYGQIPPFDTWKDLVVNVFGSTCWLVFIHFRKKTV